VSKASGPRRGRFNDRLTAPIPGLREMLRITREGGFRPKGVREDAPKIPRVQAALRPLGKGEASLTWVGHATFLVRMGGKAILTDPVWSNRLPGRIARLTPPGIEWADLPAIDAVVVSHNHYDHQDSRTLKRLPRATPVMVGLGGGAWFRKRGFTDVTELDWWQSARRSDVGFTFVPVHHWSRRGPFDLNKALWGGWVMEAEGRKAFFGGDSAYGNRFKEVGARIKGIEVAMMPIGAYEPRWFMSPVHMDPDEAVAATSDLGAKALATMHWGTFPLSREPVMQPVERVRAAWESSGRPRMDLWDLAVGQTRVWGRPSRDVQSGTEGARKEREEGSQTAR